MLNLESQHETLYTKMNSRWRPAQRQAGLDPESTL